MPIAAGLGRGRGGLLGRALILYRLLTGAPATTATGIALALLLGLMAGNEGWNALRLRRRNLRDGFAGMVVYPLLAPGLFTILLTVDGRAALILVPFLFWLGSDLAWIRALRRLNPNMS